MKRFLFTLVLTTAIVAVMTYFMPRNLNAYARQISADAEVSIYCRATDLNCIDVGSGKIVRCGVDKVDSALARCRDVDGLSIKFCGDYNDVERIAQLFDLQVTSTLDLDGLMVVCGNSHKLTGGLILDGALVNVQIAYKDGVVTVGCPLILGEY